MARISNMIVGVIAVTMVVSALLAMGLDHWWPYVAGAAACFIMVKTA